VIERARIKASPLTRHVKSGHVVAAAAVLAVAILAVLADIVIGSPGTREIRAMSEMPVATMVFDRDDKPAFTIFEERRYEVPLERMSPQFVQAVIAIEDQRFYRHHGLDLWRIAGSAWANLRSTSLEQGASTITQQLAKLSFLTPDKTLRRKLKEAYLAVRIELAFSKDEILETYLNRVYFGDGFYGVEAAARGYFSKPASNVTLEEAALLAGLIQRPSAYAPSRNAERATARRALVLESMADAGMIDRATARETAKRPLRLSRGFAHERSGAYFKQAITRELVDRFGWEMVSRGGLRVFTTLDPAAQRSAEDALTAGLAAIERRSGFRHPPRERVPVKEGVAPEYLQGAVAAIDPATGEVRALVGGRSFEESQFDRATQARRQSGSAFKPFVYAAALEQGHSPAMLVDNLDVPIPTPEGPWLPDDGHAVDYAKKLGLEAPSVPSLVLGTGDVTLLGLTVAYGAFANGGMVQRPFLIRKVEDAHGTVLVTHQPEGRRAITPQTAYQITAMLSDVVDRGTAWQARQGGFRHPAAGKTGTTNEYRDAWFVGYTADLVAGVWVGFDQPRTIVPGGYASELAVPIWGQLMRGATANSRPRPFSRPSGLVAVEVCEQSGQLAGGACRVQRVRNGESREVSTAVLEYFRRGTEPTTSCALHDDTWMRSLRASSFNPSRYPAPAPVGALAAAPSRTADPESVETKAADVKSPAAEDAPEKEKKKGFWSRLRGVFGSGDKKREETKSR
jgi:membrane peptidoglycan carboxypeptidase